MPITCQFSPEERIVTLTFSDPWSVQDLAQVYAEEQPIFDRAAGIKIHTIVDIRAMRHIPANALAHYKSPNLIYPNRGRVAVVGANAFARNLGTAAFNLINYDQAKFFTTLEEAHTYLNESTSE